MGRKEFDEAIEEKEDAERQNAFVKRWEPALCDEITKWIRNEGLIKGQKLIINNGLYGITVTKTGKDVIIQEKI